MQGKLTKIFQKTAYTPDQDLTEKIWQIVIARNRHIIRLKLWIFSFVGFTSLIGLMPAGKALLSDLSQSGFYEYFSLIFSNSGTVLSYWKELAFSLAESLPIMSIIYTLSLIFISLLSLKYLMKQVGKPARNASHSDAGGNQLSFAS